MQFDALWTLALGWLILAIASYDRVRLPARKKGESGDIYDQAIPIYLKDAKIMVKAYVTYILVISLIYVLGCILVQVIIGAAIGQQDRFGGLEFGPPTSVSQMGTFLGFILAPFADMDASVPPLVALTLLGAGTNFPLLSEGDHVSRRLAHRSVGLPQSVERMTAAIKAHPFWMEPNCEDVRKWVLDRYGIKVEAFSDLSAQRKHKIFGLLLLHDILDDRGGRVQSDLDMTAKVDLAPLWSDVDFYVTHRVKLLAMSPHKLDDLLERDLDTNLEKASFLIALCWQRTRSVSGMIDPGRMPSVLGFLRKTPIALEMPVSFVLVLSLAVGLVAMFSAFIAGMIVGQHDPTTLLPTAANETIMWGLGGALLYATALSSILWMAPSNVIYAKPDTQPRIEDTARVFLYGMAGSIIGLYCLDIASQIVKGTIAILPSVTFFALLIFTFFGGLAGLVLLAARPKQKPCTSSVLSYLGRSFLFFSASGLLFMFFFVSLTGMTKADGSIDVLFIIVSSIVIGLQGVTLTAGLLFFNWENCECFAEGTPSEGTPSIDGTVTP
ncbi:hypothetical protein [Rhodospira trueperi]|uniref:Uncharacterized protein n=1 Tax=Rhodospira trueperi TaxID=69960 RepID=A0A1G7H6F5_9PROT|nr:hypothetical protein [Rhodospira trueperi]SDE95844.1 hypothetical protein SAMN05421720_11817 [Rhodospira trueperi]